METGLLYGCCRRGIPTAGAFEIVPDRGGRGYEATSIVTERKKREA